MIELISASMMICNLVSTEVLPDRELRCKFICQDKTKQYVTTQMDYGCPGYIYEPYERPRITVVPRRFKNK